MAKRILIYTNHFYPEQFKINEVVDWMSKEGFHIRVITCIPNYPLGKFFKGYGIKSIRDDYYRNNVIVNRLPLIPRGNGNYFTRLTLSDIAVFLCIEKSCIKVLPNPLCKFTSSDELT